MGVKGFGGALAWLMPGSLGLPGKPAPERKVNKKTKEKKEGAEGRREGSRG